MNKINIVFSGCQNNEFNCSNGKCKNLYSMNDGYNDCNDESDETGSEYNCNNIELCVFIDELFSIICLVGKSIGLSYSWLEFQIPTMAL